jgi:CDP-glucose 4,6-dehydratase
MEAMVSKIVEYFVGKKVLVTGHTGFKGSWLSLWLSEMGAEVTGFALAPQYKRSHFDLLKLQDRIHHIEDDIRDADRLNAAFDQAKPDIVFHLAAQALVRKSYDDPKTTFDTNLGGSVNLLEATRRAESVQALVFITSDKCYLNKEWVWGYRENDELGGHDPYSASKAAAEMAFMAYAHSYFQSSPPGVASTRAGNVIGGGDWAADRIIPDCVRALEAGDPIVIRSPEATRPWQHVLDPLNGYLQLAVALANENVAGGGAWNFGPELDKGRTVLEVAQTAAKIWGNGDVIVDRPDNAPFEHNLLQLSIDKSKLELGWHPRWNGDQAISATISWYKRVLSGENAANVSIEQINAFKKESI